MIKTALQSASPALQWTTGAHRLESRSYREPLTAQEVDCLGITWRAGTGRSAESLTQLSRDDRGCHLRGRPREVVAFLKV